MEPEPERLGEPAEKVNIVSIKEELGKPVVERKAGSVGEQREPATCSGSLIDAGGKIFLCLSPLSSAACLSLTLVLF